VGLWEQSQGRGLVNDNVYDKWLHIIASWLHKYYNIIIKIEISLKISPAMQRGTGHGFPTIVILTEA
jgi:hypothetical protein